MNSSMPDWKAEVIYPMPVCHHSERPTGELGKWKHQKKRGRGVAGEIYSGTSHWAVVKPECIGHIHSCMCTHTCMHAGTPNLSRALQQVLPGSSELYLLVVRGTKQEHKLDLLQFTSG